MDYSDSMNCFYENYVKRMNNRPAGENSFRQLPYIEKESYERTHGKEIWEMLKIPLYQDMDNLVNNICDDKWYFFVDRLFDNNMGKDYNFRFLDKCVGLRNLTVRETLIFVNNGITPIITTYVKLLLTYDKYNKLNILKNKTKLNDDIIFNIIIKYL